MLLAPRGAGDGHSASPVGWSFLVGALLATVVGCGKPEGPAASEVTSASPADPAPSAATERAVLKLIVAAKKRLAADRAVAMNVGGYEEALARQARISQDAGLNVLVPPGPLSVPALRTHLREAAVDAGAIATGHTVGEAVQPVSPPLEHRGAGPYRYRDEELFFRYPVAVTLDAASARQVAALLAGLRTRKAPLLAIETVSEKAGATTVVGHFLAAAPTRPPVHVLEPVTVASLADAAGIAVPPGPVHPRVAALLAEHATLQPQLRAAREVLGRTHLSGTRFIRAKALAQQRGGLPQPAGAGHGHGGAAGDH